MNESGQHLAIERSTDSDYLESLIAVLHAGLTSDQYPADYGIGTRLLHADGSIFLVASINGARCGGFFLVREDGRLMVHTMLVPPARGAIAVRLGRLGLEWLWANTEANALYGHCFNDRKDVVLFARACGVHPCCEYEDGSTVNGKPVANILLKIERPNHYG